ncbi:hypothetical protein ILUMI_20657 [Ignelater luminosus]|uniref:Tc1-like transposase DDE domain-containing protein n=1 Tax=Ignelater luminosus TaxID=2038154 RepID=A0A8K0G239_IGNLU|nr:hypothetical protein ILUMI_20657 [Ignelater luminosus]
MKEEARLGTSGTSSGFFTPRKNRPKASPKSTLPKGEEEAIRTIVHDFYITEKRRPTLNAILQKMKDSELSFSGNKNTLRKVLLKLGFRWKKTEDKQKVLMDSHDIRKKRIEYLKNLIRYKKEGRNIVYIDETAAKTDSKGKRLIIVHAGGKSGFVPNALLIFPSGSKSGDYHHDMNYENFSKWLETQVLPNLPPRSVLVVDNASYHNVKLLQMPVSSTRKEEMIRWLQDKNIKHDPSLTKPELYEIIKQNKSKNITNKIDHLVEQYGHVILKLPPYHPEFNPIEKIWALVKNWVASRNVTFKLNDVANLAREKFEAIGVAEWSKICEHVEKTENEYIEKSIF